MNKNGIVKQIFNQAVKSGASISIILVVEPTIHALFTKKFRPPKNTNVLEQNHLTECSLETSRISVYIPGY